MKTQLEYDIISSLGADGFPMNFPHDELHNIVSPISYLCFTDEIHPIEALKEVFNHFNDWNDFYIQKISAKDMVEKLSKTNFELVLDDATDESLTGFYAVLCSGIFSSAAILAYKKNMDLESVVKRMNETDIWADLACAGTQQLLIDNPWSTGNLLAKWMYPDEDLFCQWQDVYEVSK